MADFKSRDDDLERAALLELNAQKLGVHTVILLGALYRKCRSLEDRIELLEKANG